MFRAEKGAIMILGRILLAMFMTTFLSGAALAKGSGHAGGAQIDLTPGKFDYYALALSWQPAFCEGHREKKECVSQTEERYDARNLAIDGLWPNKRGDRQHRYAYCGVSKKTIKLDKPDSWCKMPKLNLADETAKNLPIYMPGYPSCLQNHEWYKHGTCSGLKANEYFEAAYTLDSKIADTNFGKFISANVGETVTSDDLLKEFEKDYGTGSRKFINLFCDRADGKALLSEVRIYLKKKLPDNGILNGYFALPDKSERGNCPDSFIIDKAGFSEN
jgi:ribonuclease T2